MGIESVRTIFGDISLPAFLPWLQWHKRLSCHQVSNILHNCFWLVRWERCAPPSSDSLSSIDQDHWDYRQVVSRLDALPFLHLVLENSVVSFREGRSSHWTESCENVPCTCCVLPSLSSGSELPVGQKKIDVVRTYICLGHRGDRTLE